MSRQHLIGALVHSPHWLSSGGIIPCDLHQLMTCTLQVSTYADFRAYWWRPSPYACPQFMHHGIQSSVITRVVINDELTSTFFNAGVKVSIMKTSLKGTKGSQPQLFKESHCCWAELKCVQSIIAFVCMSRHGIYVLCSFLFSYGEF